MPPMTMTRRRALGALTATTAMAAFAPAARALTPPAAEALVRQVVDEIQRVINSGQSETQLYRDFERIFERYADVPTIARYALGPAARTASRSELAAYTDAFSGYIARKYGKRFREFVGGSIEVRGSRRDNNFIVVNAVADLRGEAPFTVDFLLSDRSGRDAFFNVIIEGINMLTTERTEIGALLDQQGGDIGRLTQRLRNT